MRFVLFYSATETFNYFTGCIAAELTGRGHAVFIHDITDYESKEHGVAALNAFVAGGLDGVICYNRLGSQEASHKNFWSSLQVPVIDIYMDPTFRFTAFSAEPPAVYIRYCCDREHIAFDRRFFPEQIKESAFLPHFGTIDEEPSIPFEERPMDILFSGTYYTPQSFLDEIDRDFPVTTAPGKVLYMVLDYLLQHPELSATDALDAVNEVNRLGFHDRQQLLIATLLTPVDWYIRMLYRAITVEKLAAAGMDVWLLGRGWENLACSSLPNVHRIEEDRIPIAATLDYMKKAKINLNVMPWFKDGTHDRIFNTLLRDSMPLTDDSRYLRQHFTDGVDIRYYSLQETDRLPEIASDILSHPEDAKRMIASGKEKVLAHYTWKNCVDVIEETVATRKAVARY